MISIVDNGGAFNNNQNVGPLLYCGVHDIQSGDLFIGFQRCKDANNPTFTFGDVGTPPQTWNYLTKRSHSSEANMRMQIATALASANATGVNFFAYHTPDVGDREAVVLQFRGVDLSSPIVSSDNITYLNGTGNLVATSVDPGSDGGMVLGFATTDMTDGLPELTPLSGWTDVPDLYSTRYKLSVIFKNKNGAGGETPSWAISASGKAMATSIALKAASAGGGVTLVRAFLLPSARGKTGLTGFVWTGEPDSVLAQKYTGLSTYDTLDPQGREAAGIQMSPAPDGTSDGQSVICVFEDPGSDDVSTWRVPGAIHGDVATPGTSPISSDSRRIQWVDPRLATTSQPQTNLVQIQSYGPNPALSTINDSTGDTYNGIVRLKRGTDPKLGGSRKAWEHRIGSDLPAYATGGTWRAEISATSQNDGTSPVIGNEIIYGLSFYFPQTSDWSHDGMALHDLHGTDTLNGGPSPISLLVGDNGFEFYRCWNALFQNSNKQFERYYVDQAQGRYLDLIPQTAVWHHFVIETKLHYNSNQGPYLRVHMARDGGATKQIINVNGPIGYNDNIPLHYPKVGPYKFTTWAAGAPRRTVWTKGIFMFHQRAGVSGEPVINVGTIMNMLQNEV